MKDYEYILDVTDKSKGIVLDHLKEITPTPELAKRLNIPYYLFCHFSNYVIINGYNYFFKQPKDTGYLVTELLGVELSKHMGLKTIKHRVLTDGENVLGLLSRNFRQPNKTYIASYHLSKEELKYIRNVLTCKNYDNTSFKKELANYLMRNFYSASTDSGPNVLCEKNEKGLSLAPLYDYENSFRNYNLASYTNDDLFKNELEKNIDIDTYFLSNLMSSPEFKSSFEKVLTFNVERSLEMIEKNQGIEIPCLLKNFFLEFDTNRKKFLLEKIK